MIWRFVIATIDDIYSKKVGENVGEVYLARKKRIYFSSLVARFDTSPPTNSLGSP
jgi:hypothetical protein